MEKVFVLHDDQRAVSAREFRIGDLIPPRRAFGQRDEDCALPESGEFRDRRRPRPREHDVARGIERAHVVGVFQGDIALAFRRRVLRLASACEVYHRPLVGKVGEEAANGVVERFRAAAPSRDEEHFFSLRDAESAGGSFTVSAEKLFADGHPHEFSELGSGIRSQRYPTL